MIASVPDVEHRTISPLMHVAKSTTSDLGRNMVTSDAGIISIWLLGGILYWIAEIALADDQVEEESD